MIVGAFTVLVPIGRVPVHKESERRRDSEGWNSYVSSVRPLKCEREADLTITVYKVLQGFEGAGLAGGVGLLLVFL